MGVSPASPSPLSGRGAVGLKAERARAGALPVRVAPCPVLPSGALEAKVPRQLAQQRRVNVPRLRLGERAAECRAAAAARGKPRRRAGPPTLAPQETPRASCSEPRPAGRDARRTAKARQRQEAEHVKQQVVAVEALGDQP